MPKARSAGLIVFRTLATGVEVLLVHPGGPYWANKDEGAWSIPKGEFAEGETAVDAARREFEEEVGPVPPGDAIELSPVRQASGKVVHAWAVEGDFDPADLKSNTFTIEWPPRSGRQQECPEVDRAAWFPFEVALRKITKGQQPLIRQLERILRDGPIP